MIDEPGAIEATETAEATRSQDQNKKKMPPKKKMSKKIALLRKLPFLLVYRPFRNDPQCKLSFKWTSGVQPSSSQPACLGSGEPLLGHILPPWRAGFLGARGHWKLGTSVGLPELWWDLAAGFVKWMPPSWASAAKARWRRHLCCWLLRSMTTTSNQDYSSIQLPGEKGENNVVAPFLYNFLRCSPLALGDEVSPVHHDPFGSLRLLLQLLLPAQSAQSAQSHWFTMFNNRPSSSGGFRLQLVNGNRPHDAWSLLWHSWSVAHSCGGINLLNRLL